MSPRKKKKDVEDRTLVEGVDVVATSIPGEDEADDEITLDEHVHIAPVTPEGDETQIIEVAPAAGEPSAAEGEPISASEAIGAEAVEAAPTEAAPAVEALPAPPAGEALPAPPVGEALPASPVGEALAAPPVGEALPAAPETVAAEPLDDAPRLSEILEKTGHAARVAVPAESREALRLAVAEWLGRALDAAPEAVDGRGLPDGLVGEAVRALGREGAPLGRLVLVAPGQNQMPLWCPLHSFEETLRDAAFRRIGATLELLLERQILVGEIGARPAAPVSAEQLLAIEEVTLTLDTPGRALGELTRLEESLARVTAQPDLLLDEERIDGLVARAQEMSAALGDAASGGLTGPLEVSLEVGSFWTAAFGGVYRLAARPPVLVLAGARGSGGDVESVRLTDPGLIDRLHASGFLTYDTTLVEQRTRELEEWALAASGVDPGPMDDAARRRTVAGRSRLMPRTWHEMIIVRRAVQAGPSGARVIHTLSPETKVKLSRPLKDLPVITRLLAELDAIDVPRQYASAPDRFARDYQAAAPLVRRHMARMVLGAVPQGAPPPPEPEPLAPEPEDDEEILFL